MKRRLAALLALLLPALPLGAASYPPELSFRSLRGPRLSVHYAVGLEAQARQALELGEELLPRLEARYGTRVPRVHVVLADLDDEPNGFALPLPYPLVQLRAAAPDGSESFGNLEGWLRLVLTHELAHVVHLNESRGLVRFGRKLFGRAPFTFPNALTPTWLIEGLATEEETVGTAFGRGRDADARSVLRLAALEGRFPGEDRPVLGLDDWPAGQASYLFGQAFLHDLEQSQPGLLARLARAQSGKVVPFFDDFTAQEVAGRSFHAAWKDWAVRARRGFEAEAAARAAAGLTALRPLTVRGYQQLGPRFSPDGGRVAYTSRTLTRAGELRVMAADGTGDRRVAERLGGERLAFTPDGRELVYDEPEVEGLYRVQGGLRRVELATGRRSWIARGLRASDPDVAGDGRVAYVERHSDRSELALIGLDGRARRTLTRSAPETQWSGPRFSPDGRWLAAARWLPGGWLDLVLVDAESGAVRELLHDRARDLEPAFGPDGRTLVFRSDRDGVSELYALRLADGALLRLTRTLGGVRQPDVAPDGRRLALASSSSRGQDLALADVALERAPAAEPFDDELPAPAPAPAPVAAREGPYRPGGSLWPRFWMPYAATVNDQWRVGAASGGFDPLLRHAWGLELHRGAETERWGARGFWQYDRLRPTLLLTGEDVSDPLADGRRLRTQKIGLRASLPLARRLRVAQSLSLAWRLERQSQLDEPQAQPFDLGGLELAWGLGSARELPYSISPVDGWRLRVAYLQEAEALGSDVTLGKLQAQARGYLRLGGQDVLAVMAAGGATFGRESFRRSWSVGGFPAGDLFDVVGTNPGVLRGYPDDFESGRSFAQASLEYRRPLFHPQRGWRTFPAFLRHLHAAAFVDAAHAWSGPFEAGAAHVGAGLALGADVYLGHGLPLTGTFGVARGFDAPGGTRGYFRLGLSF